jgi:hypothetical protein
LLIPFLFLSLRNSRKGYFIFWALAIVIILGGFSYMRNYFEAGNPLYPLNLIIAGKQIFKGVMDSAIYKAHFTSQDYGISKALFHEGLGMQTLIFVLPGIFLALPMAIIKKNRDLGFVLLYVLALPALLYLIYRYFIPLANLRYLYALLGLGLVLGFFVFEKLKIPKVLVSILVVICVIASIGELAKRQELISSILSAVFLFAVILLLRDKISSVVLVKKGVIFSFILVIITFLMLAEKWYIKNEFSRYMKMVKYSGFWPDAAIAWDWLNSNTTGNNVAYAGRPVPFPLYGSQLKNNVYYVSVNKTDPARLHYFPNSKYEWGNDFESEHRNFEAKGNYRADADYKVWLGNLTRRNTDYLFIYSLHQIKGVEFPMEDIWAKNNKNKFNLAFANETVHIYKIIK